MFNSLQVILQRHPFLMPRKFKTQSCQWYAVKRIKSVFADKGILEQDLGHLFIFPQVILIVAI